jgi:hypothetical protein
MANKEGSREGAGISATALCGCPRQWCLAATTDYHESPADYHARWRGTGVHAMAEAYGPYPGVIQERRIRLAVSTPEGVGELTGKPDWYDADRKYVEDWKSTRTAPKAPYADHIAQVNIYAYLIEKGVYDPYNDPGGMHDPLDAYYPLHVETAAIRYIDPDRAPCIPVELWSNDNIERFIRSKMAPLVRFQKTGELPTGYTAKSENWWKTRYCTHRGTGLCCGDIQGDVNG